MMIKHNQPRAAKPLPFTVYCGTIWALCAAGLAASAYLSISHYRVHTDIAYRSFCAISQSINCDNVSQSPYSVLWGLPVPVWGAIGFIGLFGLLAVNALPSARRQRGWIISLVVVSGFTLVSVLLAAVSAFWVGSYCIMCLAVYAVCLLLMYFNWLLLRRFRLGPFKQGLIADLAFLWSARRVSFALIGAVMAMVVATRLYLPPYWELRFNTIAKEIPTGVTVEGHPWIGAEQPVLEIVEFTDYLCFQCKKMHYYLRELVGRYPDKIRLVHRNYPMDHEVNFIVQEPFHVGSAKMALLSIYAARVGKFWEMNDLLYRIPKDGKPIDLQEISAALKIGAQELSSAIDDPILKKRLEIDIRYGMKHRILGTPSYMINDQLFQGFIPPEILSGMTNVKSHSDPGTSAATARYPNT
jgi:uncharacterized membrane protein